MNPVASLPGLSPYLDRDHLILDRILALCPLISPFFGASLPPPVSMSLESCSSVKICFLRPPTILATSGRTSFSNAHQLVISTHGFGQGQRLFSFHSRGL